MGRASLATPKSSRWEIPILDGQRRLIGWTNAAPVFSGGTMHHREAEELVGGMVVAAYVQIDNPADAQRAGAPADWKGSWRCLGLCSIVAVTHDGSWSGVQTVGARTAYL